MDNNNDAILREMTEQSDEIFFIYDPHKSRFTYVNTAFEEITKKSSKELYENPLPLLEMIHPEDLGYVKKNFALFDNRKTTSMLDFRIIRPDKVERWLRLKVYPIMHEGKVQHITGVAEDDSARRASIFNMQKVNGWKDSILDILAHDLRGPLGITRTLASVIAKDLPEEKHQKSREWLKMIEDISKRNLDLIKDLLTREALDTVGVEMSKERTDLVWEIKQVMDIFFKSQENIKKQFECTFSHEQIYADIDSMKFLQIINNLVSNGLKFTREQGMIKVHTEMLEKSVLITVEDNGIGIPKNLHPILFHKRTKAGRTGVN